MSFYKKVNLPPIYQLILTGLFPKKERLKVLDLGCGLGTAGELFNNKKNHNFTGIDFFQPYLNICKRNGYYRSVIKADLTKIKLLSRSYDVVLLLQVLEHLTDKEARLLLKQVTAAARECIIISLPNGHCDQGQYDQNRSHIHKSTWFHEQLEALGFKVYGQSFKPVFGNKSFGAGEKAKLWQHVAVFLSVFIAPLIYIKPEWGAQLIGIKYVK
ncbi:MAG: class I SAM-dependent methyltransferase [Candidatus Levybacteria bacterium]|nr:class I SAM-dependent methyltransferase [Candidatus Levybacteria bacterium]